MCCSYQNVSLMRPHSTSRYFSEPCADLSKLGLRHIVPTVVLERPRLTRLEKRCLKKVATVLVLMSTMYVTIQLNDCQVEGHQSL